MTVNKRKKVTKYRGSQTHGGGAKKKRRGAGNRGGRGMAGSGKRADQNKPFIIKKYGNKYFGKRGFRIPQKKKKYIKIINISYFSDQILKRLLDKGVIEKKENKYHIHLKKLGFDKLLGSGELNKELHIIGKVSKKAREKIEKQKGSIRDEE